MTFTTYLGDCIDVMRSIPDKSIDMILTDPPYGVLNKDNPDAKWDAIIPFKDMWREYTRITKPESAIILFGQGMFSADLMHSNREMWRYNLIWEKDRPTGFLNAARMPLRSHEDIMVFYDRLPTYNPQMTPCKPSERVHPIGNGPHTDRNRQYGNFSRVHNPTIRDEKFPKSVIHVKKEHECKGDDHPTQKPVELCEWLIATYTNKGDVVLDSCMGSGTTGVACANLGRDFIGIEANPKYYEMANIRLRESGAEIREVQGDEVLTRPPRQPKLSMFGFSD